jgi:hypothetical protein
MNKLLFFLLFFFPTWAFSLEIVAVKNAQLKDLFLYNGSQLEVIPEQGARISVKGKANKRVRLEIKVNGVVYLTRGIRIADLHAKNAIITLDKFGEGEFEIGFSLLGEKNVSGEHKKAIKYKVGYVD